MGKTEIIHIKVDDNLKKKAEEILNKNGITLEDAIYMFFKQLALSNVLPFEIKSK